MTDVSKLAEYEDMIRALTVKCEELVAENTRLRSADGAHDVLRRIYLNEAESSATRLKAAQASINFEKSRFESVPPPLELTAAPVEDLATLIHRRRRRQAALEAGDKVEKWIERADGTYPADNDTSSERNS